MVRRGIIFPEVFQDAKRTRDGLIYILCKGWNRHRGQLRGALRARRDGVTVVAHLAPDCPRRSALMIPQRGTMYEHANINDRSIRDESYLIPGTATRITLRLGTDSISEADK